MRIELSEGQWAEVADVESLLDGDRKAVNRAVTLTVEKDGRRTLPGSMDDDMQDALLARICTDWSLPMPPPSQDLKSLDKLSIAQAHALHEAVKPHMSLVKGEVNPNDKTSDPTEGSSS
jgi:hypothetical protein